MYLQLFYFIRTRFVGSKFSFEKAMKCWSLDPEIDRVELHDRSRTIADPLDFSPLSRLYSTLVNRDRLFS